MIKKNNLEIISYFSFIISIVGVSIFSILQSNLTIFFLYIIFFFSGLVLILKKEINIRSVYIIGFSLNTLFCSIFYYILIYEWGSPYSGGGSDDRTYELLAEELTSSKINFFNFNELRKEIIPSGHNSPLYPFIVSLLIRLSNLIGEYHTLIPRLFNSMILAFISVLVYLISIKLNLSRRLSAISSITVSIFPIMMLFSSYLLRDILTSFIICSLFYLIITNEFKYSFLTFYRLIISIFLIILLMYLRAPHAFLILIIIFLLFLENFKKRYLIFFLLTLILILSFIYREIIIDQIIFNIDQIQKYTTRKTLTRGLSNFIFEQQLLPFGIFLRSLYLLISPFPSLADFERTFLTIGVITQMFFLPYLFLGLKKIIFYSSNKFNLSNRLLLMFFIFLFFGTAIFSFTIRHMTQFIPFGIIIIAIGYQNYKFRFFLFMVMFLILLILFSIYLLIKVV